MLIIIFQEKCNGKYDSVDLATTIVKKYFSKHLCPVEVYLEKSNKVSSKRFHRVIPETKSGITRGYDYSWSKDFLNATSTYVEDRLKHDQNLVSFFRSAPGGWRRLLTD